MTIFAARARLQTGWATDVRLVVQNGQITDIQTNTTAQPDDTRVDTLLPAQSNLHSHSFQRAMAGMTEFRGAGQESFWTWRRLMYQFLDHLTPDHINAIAAQAFMEMQLAGYAAVGEFHYIHHAQGGQPYDNLAELSTQIINAAVQTGIGLTHLPVLYTYGDVDAQPLAGGQKRFGNNFLTYLKLLDRCDAMVRDLPADTCVGVAPHSLRATSPADLQALITTRPAGPVHIHIAEQMIEVNSVREALGARPVEWLLDQVDVTDRWCLIHATHMTATETTRLAATGAVAGLCPVTEANLGDGIFNGTEYLTAKGRFGIGTDSNMNISVTGELKQLEYSQRLKHKQRNVMATANTSTGETLYANAAAGGAQALNRNAGAITIGKLADLVAIDSTHPRLCALHTKHLIDGYLFAANSAALTDLWSAGRHCVKKRHHIAQDTISAQYRAAMSDLIANIDE